MNPTYEVGDVVQIISKEEVLSHPTDNFGNFILTHSLYGCPAVITGISMNLYKLTPLFAKDKTVFHWDDWYFYDFEFHPYIVSPPPGFNVLR